ncbi:MAG: 3-deoxy-manno-octulosonate cytidylyltransferase [Dysgonamonadaceae bacterium]|nr:3-deoxy-manno-octulosonate cytidylyltransferase [Dysgonamonadaceae bacterium]
MKFLGIIPARYASTRFPGKPLADMRGKPMIQRVYEQVAHLLDDLIVATDDERIVSAVEAFGGAAVLTSPDHRSGTDRCFEAYGKSGRFYDVVLNIQGDEPFIKPSQIRLLQDCFKENETQIATLIKPYTGSDDFESLFDPNTPKVIVNSRQQAIYFSRSVVPYCRGLHHTEWLKNHTYYKHIGLYGYRSEVLKAITALPPTPLETAESLEQLRWIENGYVLKTAVTTEDTIGIDTPGDLEKALLRYPI